MHRSPDVTRPAAIVHPHSESDHGVLSWCRHSTTSPNDQACASIFAAHWGYHAQ